MVDASSYNGVSYDGIGAGTVLVLKMVSALVLVFVSV